MTEAEREARRREKRRVSRASSRVSGTPLREPSTPPIVSLLDSMYDDERPRLANWEDSEELKRLCEEYLLSGRYLHEFRMEEEREVAEQYLTRDLTEQDDHELVVSARIESAQKEAQEQEEKTLALEEAARKQRAETERRKKELADQITGSANRPPFVKLATGAAARVKDSTVVKAQSPGQDSAVPVEITHRSSDQWTLLRFSLDRDTVSFQKFGNGSSTIDGYGAELGVPLSHHIGVESSLYKFHFVPKMLQWLAGDFSLVTESLVGVE
ncbi:hypothetical protein B0H11DRAFT_1917725 [Mycena galericulata]|nr:hypothetical protein B0H11DRAFT_1917725 [Mycena galericulata]